MERDDTLSPIEAKKTASPSRKDARNLNVLDSVNASDVTPEFSVYKRGIGQASSPAWLRTRSPQANERGHSRFGRFSARRTSLRDHPITKQAIAHHVT